MIVRLTVTDEAREAWFRDVARVESTSFFYMLTFADGQKRHLSKRCGVLLVCATEEDVLDALAEEREVKPTAMDEVRR